MGPNRRAQDRERAAARTAAEAKRAEAERKAVADAQKIVAIWNARQAGGRALWFYPTIGAAIAAGVPWLPTHAQRASKSAASTCAPLTGIRARRFPASSRRCHAGGARLTRRLRGWKCWRRNGLGGSRRQTEYRKRKYNCGFSAQTCNVVKDTKNGEETHD